MRRPRSLGLGLAWMLFFLVGCSLGYPTVNRYDLRQTSATTDAQTYLGMVETGPPYPAAEDENRVLLPMLARPVYLVMRGHIGTWDPATLALLVVDAAMMATAATFLVKLTGELSDAPGAGLVAGFLLMTSFLTTNVYLAGFIDAGELAALVVLVAALWFRKWWWLPILGILGAAAKETFVLSSVVLAGVWLAATWNQPQRWARAAWTAVMAVAGLATAVALLSWNRHGLFWPWDLASEMQAPAGHGGLPGNLRRAVLNGGSVYAFAWLVPLGVWRLRWLPRAWLLGAGAAALAALAISVFDDASANTARIVFLVAGPPLCVSAALLLTTGAAGTAGTPAGLAPG